MTGCSQHDSTDPSLFQLYLVNPMENFIYFLAEVDGGSFGVAIILITIIIRLVLMPLMLKQYKSQQLMKVKMANLKPEMDSIQEKLKNTKDAKEQKVLQLEMMNLYRKHNVNPLSMGCLPLIIQMPILMALYYAISHSTEIATHSFLWFNLGQPDVFITLIAGLIYYLQFKVSQINLSMEQQKQMRIMGMLSPIMIMVFSFTAPAALPLYWCVGGLFLICQTLLGQRLYKQEESTLNNAQLD